LGIVLNEEDKRELIYKNVKALKKILVRIHDKFQFNFIKSKENRGFENNKIQKDFNQSNLFIDTED